MELSEDYGVMPHVPLSFDTSPDGDVTDLLETSEQDGLLTVRWPLLSLTVVHSVPSGYYGPSLDDVATHTPGFRAHGLYGFSLGQYTELFTITEFGGRLAPSAVRLGEVEFTLGEVSPLGRYLFAPHYDDDVHGEWDNVWSMRLWMCPPELAEAYILEGHAALHKQHGLSFNFFSFDYDLLEEETNPPPIHAALPPAVVDIEPLRLYHDGYTQSNSTTAILQFYRVLEYYSIVSRHAEIDALRRRTDLTSRDFTIQVARLVSDEERSNICRLVGAIADGATLKFAADQQLVDKPLPHVLGNALYDFRNSIVHAKHDGRAPMFIPSPFESPPQLNGWRRVLDKLARSAIDRFGRRAL